MTGQRMKYRIALLKPKKCVYNHASKALCLKLSHSSNPINTDLVAVSAADKKE